MVYHVSAALSWLSQGNNEASILKRRQKANEKEAAFPASSATNLCGSGEGESGDVGCWGDLSTSRETGLGCDYRGNTLSKASGVQRKQEENHR